MSATQLIHLQTYDCLRVCHASRCLTDVQVHLCTLCLLRTQLAICTESNSSYSGVLIHEATLSLNHATGCPIYSSLYYHSKPCNHMVTTLLLKKDRKSNSGTYKLAVILSKADSLLYKEVCISPRMSKADSLLQFN